MDKMNGTKEATVMRGMSSVYSGLGMLLGAGRISTVTHDHILSLINEEEAPERKENDGEKPHLGTPRLRKDPQPSLTKPKHNVANTRPENPKPDGNHETCTQSVDSSSNETQATWHSAIPGTSPSSSQHGSATASSSSAAAAAAAEPPVSNLVCPWYSTAGYHCREQREGKCAWLHESSPDAVTDPLICPFWAENNCVKTAESCRFAHFWAQHRQIAPTPGSRFKRQKNIMSGGWR